jgi:hypothetical protein
MTNLRLDIEDKLWTYLNTEAAFQLIDFFLMQLPSNERADNTLANCKEIIDPYHSIYRLCHGIAKIHGVSVTIKIFEGDEYKFDQIFGCIPGDNFLYFYFQPRILTQLFENEINLIIRHEIGHYFFRTSCNPEEIIKKGLHKKFIAGEKDQLRFKCISLMLSQISEFNADRFAAFDTKNILAYQDTLKKLYKAEELLKTNPTSIEERRKLIAFDWKNRFESSHPLIDDRVAALDFIEKYVNDTNFDINKAPEVYDKMLELLSYKEFMQEYGDYYEERLKSSN